MDRPVTTTVEGIDGSAAVWIHEGESDIPPSVQLDLTDGTVQSEPEPHVGISLTPHQAIDLAFALKQAAYEVVRRARAAAEDAIVDEMMAVVWPEVSPYSQKDDTT